MFRVLRAVKAHLAAVARTLDPDTLTVDQAADAIALLAAVEKAAAGLRLLLSRRVDNASLFGQGGDRSAAEWLAKQTGQSTRDAEADLACSKRLTELPDAEDAVRNGELSPDQAKAVADGAAADPRAERELLDTARRGSLGELARQSKARKAAALGDDEARRRAAHRNRSFRTGTNAMGEGWGSFTGPAEFVVRLQARMKPFLDAEFARARAEGRRERAEAYAFDALAALLGLADEGPAAGDAEGSAAPAGDASTGAPVPPSAVVHDKGSDGATPTPAAAPAKRPKADARIILRADVRAVRRGSTEPGELCDVAGLGPIPVADLLEFLPQAAIDLVVTNGVDVFNVTNLGRRATARQQVVLDLLNIGCTRQGCTATAHLQVDHRIDWAKIKVTELTNLDWLCPHCHRLKTHDGWQLEPGTGKRAMLPPAEQWWHDDQDDHDDHGGNGPPGDPPESHAA